MPETGQKKDAFLAAFATLRQAYVQQLPARLDELAAAMRRCQEHPEDRDALVTLHRAAHTMAGSAGSFGCNALGEDARRLEHLLQPLLQQPALSPADLQAPAGFLRQLTERHTPPHAD